MNKDNILQIIIKSLEEDKGIDITTLNVTELTNVTDYMVICSATSTRHAKTLADKLVRRAREAGVRPLNNPDEQGNDWLLIDFIDVVVHIMLPETRQFYDLEKLWSTTKSVREKIQHNH